MEQTLNSSSNDSVSSALASQTHISPIIAVDLMGGDSAPTNVLEACNNFLKTQKDCKILGFGYQLSASDIISQYKFITNENFTIVDSESVISDSDQPVVALRASKGSSMRMAIEAVRDGRAHAIVSAGNTGALMAIAKLVLKTINEIDRPALVAIIPSIKGQSCMLDLGANTVCDARNLYEFAFMGNDFAKIILEKKNPTIGLLNIGKEEIKGNDAVRGAAELIRETNLNFIGYIEGNQILFGDADVIVADGFSGNIALKTMEGTAKFCVTYLKKIAADSVLAKLLLLLVAPFFSKKLASIDPRKYNAGVFLGLNGVVVKSHGGADSIAFANSLTCAYKLSKFNFVERLSKWVG